jgi:acyl-coenzyme A thioesterase 7
VTCRRTLTPLETAFQMVRQVNPPHANPLGILHGGYMLEWITDAATITAMRVARSYTLLACMEDMVFISPVRVGDTVTITTWVEYTGRSSMELSLIVETENPMRGERVLTTYSSLTMVSVDENLKPKPLDVCVEPRLELERELYARALERREARRPRIERRREAVNDTSPPRFLSEEYSITSYFIVNPESSIGYNVLHAGKLLRVLDEVAAIVASRYTGNVVVTGSVNATDFYSPIRVGEVVEVRAGISYVGVRSVEVLAKVLVRNPLTWEARHAATSYFTFVSLGADGRSVPVRGFKPVEEWQYELLKEGFSRKVRRDKLISMLKSGEFQGWVRRLRDSFARSV